MRKVFSANGGLWILQGLLAVFFAGASGLPKFIFPAEMLNMPIPLDMTFVKFIGTCEILGALGLILPGVTHIQPRLTTLAASALVLLTICAATYQLMANQPANAVFALIIGALCAVVAYNRARGFPLRGSVRSNELTVASCP